MSLLLQVEFWNDTWLGHTIKDYLWFAGLVAVALLLARPFTLWIARISSNIAKRFSQGKYGKLFRSLIVKPLQGLIQTVLLYAAVNRISKVFEFAVIHRNYKKKEINVRLIDIIDHLFLLFLIIFSALLISRIIDFIFRINIERSRHKADKERIQILPLMRELVKLLWWATCFFTLLGIVLHVNIPALITGLGIGGVAIALAGKETVENLFASFTILIDKPFQTDDTVRLGNIEGRVEKIGFRSTRLRNVDGSVFIIPNKKLVDENLENMTQRDTRRVKLIVTIKYGIAHEQLQQMIAELKDMIQKTTHVQEPVEISLENFGENAFQLLLSYHLPEPLPDNDLRSIKQQISMDTFSIVSSYTKAIQVKTETKDDHSETALDDHSSNTDNA